MTEAPLHDATMLSRMGKCCIAIAATQSMTISIACHSFHEMMSYMLS